MWSSQSYTKSSCPSCVHRTASRWPTCEHCQCHEPQELDDTHTIQWYVHKWSDVYYIQHRRVVEMSNSRLRPTTWHINPTSRLHIIHQVVVTLRLAIIDRIPQFPQQLSNGHFAVWHAIHQTCPLYSSSYDDITTTWYMHISCDIPYNGKILRKKNFSNFVDRLPFVKIFFATILLNCIALCLYIEGKVTHMNLFCKNSKFKTFAKIFSRENFPLYGIHTFIQWYYTVFDNKM